MTWVESFLLGDCVRLYDWAFHRLCLVHRVGGVDSKSLLSIENHEKRFHQIVSTGRFFSNTYIYLQHDDFLGSFT